MKILDHLVQCLRKAGEYNRHDTASPSAILWTDGDKSWEGVCHHLSKVMPEFLMLSGKMGEYFGGGTFIRYQISRKQNESLPVIYLPGVSRQQFRSAIAFPEIAKHLYPLQFFGKFWTQDNGKDWTPFAFLTSANGGLGLELARDKATGEALNEQIETLLFQDVAELTGKKIGAEDLHEMGAGDTIRLLLEWIENPKKAEKKWGKEEKKAFLALCKKEYGFDPEKDGHMAAIEKLIEGEGKWERVWKRFEDAYTSFPGLPETLEKYRPAGLFDEANPRSPLFNKSQETELRERLTLVKELSFKEAQISVGELARKHTTRADSVWAKLDQAPLAISLKYLNSLSEKIIAGLAGNTWGELAGSYLSEGWKIDRDAREAVNAVRTMPDLKAVTGVLQAVYRIWLEELANRVQAWAPDYPKKGIENAASFLPEPGLVYVFVDGLRVDLAQELIDICKSKGLSTESEVTWSALPSVTATAKPAWKPMVEKVKGEAVGDGFQPSSLKTGKSFETADFRKSLKELEFDFFKEAETGNPDQCGWTEIGKFDTYGHDQGAKLAWRIREEMDAVVGRIGELIEAGWKKIVVVTDHGWIWLPGGFPKIDLPKHLTSSKWGRCAVPKAGVKHGLPQVGWFWNPIQEIALAPGIGNFGKEEYAHGGMSLQECLTLKIHIQPSPGMMNKSVTIESIKWVRLKLGIQLSGSFGGVSVDVRSRANDPKSSLLCPPGKPVDQEGKASLFVENEDTEGQAAFLVATRGDEVLAKQNVTIGEN